MAATRKVRITFVDSADKQRAVSIMGVRSGLTGSDIRPLAQALIANTSALKNTLVSAKKAEIIAQTVTPVSVE